MPLTRPPARPARSATSRRRSPRTRTCAGSATPPAARGARPGCRCGPARCPGRSAAGAGPAGAAACFHGDVEVRPQHQPDAGHLGLRHLGQRGEQRGAAADRERGGRVGLGWPGVPGLGVEQFGQGGRPAADGSQRVGQAAGADARRRAARRPARRLPGRPRRPAGAAATARPTVPAAVRCAGGRAASLSTALSGSRSARPAVSRCRPATSRRPASRPRPGSAGRPAAASRTRRPTRPVILRPATPGVAGLGPALGQQAVGDPGDRRPAGQPGHRGGQPAGRHDGAPGPGR